MLTLEQLQGQEIMIGCMKLDSIGNQLMLSMDICCKGDTGTVLFRNVSSLCIDRLSYPLHISGFEVKENLRNGWQADSRYQVHDFEDGTICFYCESVEVSPV